ncbi:MAG: tetratricopeptide repeat protein [Puniceicoccales bacterium]
MVIIALVTAALVAWRAHTLEQLESRNAAALEQAIEENNFPRAREALARLSDETAREQARDKINEAELAFAVDRHDAPSVRRLADEKPALVENNEDAHLLLARAAMHADDEGTYDEQLAKATPGTPAEILLRVDKHLRTGETDEARELLEGNSFTATDEANRLIRLAMLNARNPARARELLTAAILADRAYPEPYAFRGQLFEAMGDWQRARADYTAALVAAPDKPLFWDQLAEFYRRRQSYPQAVDTWVQGYERTGTAEFWIKAWFWQKLTGLGEALPLPPEDGPWAGYATYLNSLPADTYWNSDTFATLPYASRIQARRQESYWLRLLAALQQDDATTAREMLDGDPFAKRSWAPKLKELLLAILKWREERPYTLPPASDPEARHQFYTQMETLSGTSAEDTPRELGALLSSPAAWSAAALTEGWLGVATTFSQGQPLDHFPDWYRYGLAVAFTQTGAPERGLAVLESATRSPQSDCLLGELLIRDGQTDKAEAILRPLAAQEDATGLRAAWLVALLLTDQQQLSAAAAWIDAHPAFSASATGQELLARIALLQGNADRALEIYNGIQQNSLEAKVYLSKVAYAREDWQRARELTRELISAMPDEPAFWRNLQAIDKADQTTP